MHVMAVYDQILHRVLQIVILKCHLSYFVID